MDLLARRDPGSCHPNISRIRLTPAQLETLDSSIKMYQGGNGTLSPRFRGTLSFSNRTYYFPFLSKEQIVNRGHPIKSNGIWRPYQKALTSSTSAILTDVIDGQVKRAPHRRRIRLYTPLFMILVCRLIFHLTVETLLPSVN